MVDESEDFKVLTNFERETLQYLNSFRENPKFLEKDLITLRDGLCRFRPSDIFIKDIDSFLKYLRGLKRMHELELNDSLSKYAKQELDKYMEDPDSFPAARRGADCSGLVSSSYLGENPGIIYTMGAQDPLNVVEKIIFNEKDSHRLGKQILTSMESSQLGISHETDEETGENYTVLIFADNYVDDDKEKLPDGDLSHLKFAFDLLDYDKEGRCKVNNVLDVMSELGIDETDPSLFDIIKGMDNSPYVSWPKFANYVFDRMNDRYTYAGLNDIFQIFKDNVERNYIDLSTLRELCNELGIKKNDVDLIRMLKDTTGKETIEFEDFCEILGIEFDLLKSDEYMKDPKTLRTLKIINKSLNKTINARRIISQDTDLSANKSINFLDKSLKESVDDNSYIFKKKKVRYEA